MSEARHPPGITEERFPSRPRVGAPVLNRTGLSAWTIPWNLDGDEVLAVVVKATCDLGEGIPAALKKESAPPLGDVFVEDDPARSITYPSDFAIVKPRADVVVIGTAHAEGRRAATCVVTLRFGGKQNRIDKSLAVFGRRRWEGGLMNAMSPPEPFETVPLTHERAFGGPGFDANPVGLGLFEWLPQLELPSRLITSPADRPPPAALGPIAPTWRARLDKLGSFDAR